MNEDTHKIEQLTVQFDGHPITTMLYREQPVWIAREVGVALGYEQEGKGLLACITQKWQDEFIQDIDVLTIQNGELRELQDAISGGDHQSPSEIISPKTTRLTLLTQSGIYLACLKTHKEAGVRLRRLLADTILPQLHRTGHASLPGAPSPTSSMSSVEAKMDRLLEWATQHDATHRSSSASSIPEFYGEPLRPRYLSPTASLKIPESLPLDHLFSTRDATYALGLNNVYQLRTIVRSYNIGRKVGSSWVYTRRDLAMVARILNIPIEGEENEGVATAATMTTPMVTSQHQSLPALPPHLPANDGASDGLRAFRAVVTWAYSHQTYFFGRHALAAGQPVQPHRGWSGKWDADDLWATMEVTSSALKSVLNSAGFSRTENILAEWKARGWIDCDPSAYTKSRRLDGGRERMVIFLRKPIEKCRAEDSGIDENFPTLPRVNMKTPDDKSKTVAFLKEWRSRFGLGETTTEKLLDSAAANGIYPSWMVMKPDDTKSATASLGRFLNQLAQLPQVGGFRVMSRIDNHTKARRWWLETVAE